MLHAYSLRKVAEPYRHLWATGASGHQPKSTSNWLMVKSLTQVLLTWKDCNHLISQAGWIQRRCNLSIYLAAPPDPVEEKRELVEDALLFHHPQLYICPSSPQVQPHLADSHIRCREIDRLHLFQPAWLMRWWYIVTWMLNIVTIVHRSAKRKDCKASDQANCCSVPPTPPPPFVKLSPCPSPIEGKPGPEPRLYHPPSPIGFTF